VQTELLPTEIVIKDYFVTLALKMLFSKYTNIVFVGGTSLSKCFNIINRFSEDVDLVAIGSSRKEKQRITENVLNYFVDNWNFGIEHESRRMASDFKPMLLEYENLYPGIITSRIKIELFVFTTPFPVLKVNVNSYVNKILTHKEIKKYEMEPFQLITQEPKRTFVEKILLQKEIYKDYINRILSPETAKDRARDFYDIYKIWNYYNGTIPITKDDFFTYLESRNSNRKGKTIINHKEFNDISLEEQFKTQNISRHLIIDEKKISIRDLNINDIIKTLKLIDKYFVKILI
jgi:predicted nucleotidyltransferase component of viral defense system